MIRKIYCQKCGERVRQVEPPYQQRTQPIEVGDPPAKHGISLNGRFEKMDHIKCDGCGETIPKGTMAWCESYWRPTQEPEPQAWEHQYGKIL